MVEAVARGEALQAQDVMGLPAHILSLAKRAHNVAPSTIAQPIPKAQPRQLEAHVPADRAAEEGLRVLSRELGTPVTYANLLQLFIEILKITIEGRDQDRIWRRNERDFQLERLQKVCDSFKSQAKFTRTTGIGAGVLAIVSGIMPIACHLKGDAIQGALGRVFSSMKDMDTDKFSEALTKMTFAMSEMQKTSGQVQTTFQEGHRAKDQEWTALHRSYSDEKSQDLQDAARRLEEIIRFLISHFDRQHELARQLYS